MNADKVEYEMALTLVSARNAGFASVSFNPFFLRKIRGSVFWFYRRLSAFIGG
jgi:hypothetical protein